MVYLLGSRIVTKVGTHYYYYETFEQVWSSNFLIWVATKKYPAVSWVRCGAVRCGAVRCASVIVLVAALIKKQYDQTVCSKVP